MSAIARVAFTSEIGDILNLCIGNFEVNEIIWELSAVVTAHDISLFWSSNSETLTPSGLISPKLKAI